MTGKVKKPYIMSIWGRGQSRIHVTSYPRTCPLHNEPRQSDNPTTLSQRLAMVEPSDKVQEHGRCQVSICIGRVDDGVDECRVDSDRQLARIPFLAVETIMGLRHPAIERASGEQLLDNSQEISAHRLQCKCRHYRVIAEHGKVQIVGNFLPFSGRAIGEVVEVHKGAVVRPTQRYATTPIVVVAKKASKVLRGDGQEKVVQSVKVFLWVSGNLSYEISGNS
jgi:hypothetical protein